MSEILEGKRLKISYPLTWGEFFKGTWTPNCFCSLIIFSFSLLFLTFRFLSCKIFENFIKISMISIDFSQRIRDSFSAPREVLLSSLKPLESFLKGLSNGTRLDIVRALGAKYERERVRRNLKFCDFRDFSKKFKKN